MRRAKRKAKPHTYEFLIDCGRYSQAEIYFAAQTIFLGPKTSIVFKNKRIVFKILPDDSDAISQYVGIFSSSLYFPRDMREQDFAKQAHSSVICVKE